MKVYTHANYSYVRVAEILRNEVEKISFDLCQQPKETLAAYYKRQNEKPELLVNAGFFAMNTGETCFSYISDSKIINSVPFHRWGIGVVGDNNIVYGEINSRQWKGWISGYPNLIDGGKKLDINYALELNYKARRTMLGYNDTTIYIVCVENPGMDFTQMQDLMLGLGCKYAINLDGGGSTKMLHNGKSVTKNWTNRAIDNVLAIYLKKEETTRQLYKVQLGAFSVKQNAEQYLKTIKNLDAVYSSAYITYVDGLYKIQVGAFSVRQNAENMLEDLKKRGISAFIVTKTI